jgi:hypothetical protein
MRMEVVVAPADLERVRTCLLQLELLTLLLLGPVLPVNLRGDEGTTDPIQYFQRSLQQVAVAVALKKELLGALTVEVVAEVRKLLPDLLQVVLVTRLLQPRRKGTTVAHQQPQPLHGMDLAVAEHPRQVVTAVHRPLHLAERVLIQILLEQTLHTPGAVVVAVKLQDLQVQVEPVAELPAREEPILL